MPIIDASVYVALSNADEPGYEPGWRWFEATLAADQIVFAPVILLAEVGAAISRGSGNALLAHQVVDQLLETGAIALVEVGTELAALAAAIAIDCRIRGADAVYVALAEHLEDELVTFDRQQLERAKELVKARTP